MLEDLIPWEVQHHALLVQLANNVQIRRWTHPQLHVPPELIQQRVTWFAPRASQVTTVQVMQRQCYAQQALFHFTAIQIQLALLMPFKALTPPVNLRSVKPAQTATIQIQQAMVHAHSVLLEVIVL